MNGMALLVLDMQVDFLAPFGRFALPQTVSEPLLSATNLCVDHAQLARVPVLYVRNTYRVFDLQNPFRRYAAVEDTPGAEFDPRLRVTGKDTYVKRESDAFSNPLLEYRLCELATERVYIAGVFAEACVSATARGAHLRGYHVSIVSDAVAGASLRRVATSLSRMSEHGIRLVRSIDFCAQSQASSA